MAEEPSACASASAAAPWRGSGTRTACRATAITATQNTTASSSTRAAGGGGEDDRDAEQRLKPSTAQYLPATSDRGGDEHDAVRREPAARRSGCPGRPSRRRRRRALATPSSGGEDRGDGDRGRPLAGSERVERGARPRRRARASGRSRGSSQPHAGGSPADDSPPAGSLETPSLASSSAGRGSPRTRSASGAYGCADPTATPSSSRSSAAARSGSWASVIARTTTARRGARRSMAAGSVAGVEPADREPRLAHRARRVR